MKLKVDNQIINYVKIETENYISITDMIKSKDGNFFVNDWLRNRNTIDTEGIFRLWVVHSVSNRNTEVFCTK